MPGYSFHHWAQTYPHRTLREVAKSNQISNACNSRTYNHINQFHVNANAKLASRYRHATVTLVRRLVVFLLFFSSTFDISRHAPVTHPSRSCHTPCLPSFRSSRLQKYRVLWCSYISFTKLISNFVCISKALTLKPV